MRRAWAVAAVVSVLAFGGACSTGGGSTGGVVAEVSTPRGAKYLTHGDDPLPPPPTRAAQLAREEPWPCDGTGTDGARVQMLYAHGTGTGDLAANRSTLESYARRVEGAFAASAQAEGAYRVVRFVTTPDCQLVIDDVTLSDAGLQSFDTFISELEAKGYNDPNRKYHAWVESSAFCGIGTVAGDDQPGQANASNSGPSYSRSDRPCWNYAEAHEILHNLGAVQLSAPNSTGAWHCRDEHDVECYADGGPKGQTFEACPDAAFEDRLDCKGDDYFNAGQPAGYLATHWNVASSRFLDSAPSPASTTTTTLPGPTTTMPPPNTTTTSVGKGKTATQVSVLPPALVGQATTVTAGVAGACGPTGFVAFRVSGELVSRQPLKDGFAQATLVFAKAGRFTVRADYEGDGRCAASRDSVRPRVKGS